MKLYATVTSERASKGQGGNKFLAIEIKDDNQETIGIVRLRPVLDTIGDGIQVGYWFDERLMRVQPEKIPYTKGEKKKDEMCINCGKPKNTEFPMCTKCSRNIQ